MAFDPDAYLAAVADDKGGSNDSAQTFDPDAYLAAVADEGSSTGPKPQQSQPSGLESAGRGLLQSVTFGFADEVSGAAESLFGDKTYKEARDESRKAFAQAREAHPWLYAGGELAGAFVPGLGAGKIAALAGKGAKAVAKISGAGKLVDKGLKTSNALVRGATATAQSAGQAAVAGGAMGAIGAVGASEGETVGEVIKDGLSGGVVGATLSGVLGAVVGGASARLRARAVARAGEKGTPTARANLEKVQDDFTDMVFSKEGEPLREALGLSAKGLLKGKDAAKTAKAVDTLLKPIQKTRNAAYKGLDEASGVGGMRMSRLRSEVQKVQKLSSQSPATLPMADALRHVDDDIVRGWAAKTNPDGDAIIPFAEVRKYVTSLQTKGFSGTGQLDPGLARQLRQEVSRVVKTAMETEMAEVVAKAPKAIEHVETIKEVNKQISALMRTKTLANQVAAKDAFPQTGLRDIAQKGIDAALLFSGNVKGFATKKAAEFVLPRAAVAADLGLARLVAAARRGSNAAQIAEMATSYGIPAVVARKVISDFGTTEDYSDIDLGPDLNLEGEDEI
jgi:hypothetical protein